MNIEQSAPKTFAAITHRVCGSYRVKLFCAALLNPLLLAVAGCSQSEPQTNQPPAPIVAKSQSSPAASLKSIGAGNPDDSTRVVADATVAVVSRAGTADAGWPVFRGDALSTGVSAVQLPAELEVVWEYKVPGSNGAFEGTAVIAKHSQTGKPIAYIGDLDGVVYAFDLASGELNWKKQPKVTLAPSEEFPKRKPKEHEAFSFSSSPAYQDGQIFIGDIDGIFYCFDESGELLWFHETEGEISSSPNFYEGHVLFGSQDAKLYLLDTRTGEKKWDLETPDQIRCSVTVVDDRAFVAGCDGFFHIVDLKNGTEAEKVDIKSPTQSTPAVLGDQVYFGTEQDEFVAIDWKTATAKWAFSDEEGPSPVRGCAAVTEGHVVFGARNRFVYSVDPESGQKNWAVELRAKVDGSPVIAGENVYVGSTDGRFYTLSLNSGAKVWEKQFDGGFVSSPAVGFGKLVVATDRGVVYCLGKKEK